MYIIFISLAMVGTQLVDAHFSRAIRGSVSQWMHDNSLESCLAALDNPVELGAHLLPQVIAALTDVDVDLYDVQRSAWSNPLIHLRAVFDIQDLPETPSAFIPVPDVATTVAARASAVVCLAALNSDTISYGSENDGHLFVNLVVLPGDGEFADKSKSNMRGHTDGVSFPVRGQLHEFDQRVAPSPDFVCLSGLRNPAEADGRGDRRADEASVHPPPPKNFQAWAAQALGQGQSSAGGNGGHPAAVRNPGWTLDSLQPQCGRYRF
jgi:hypothetical protein